MYGGLSLDQAPPLSVPMKFYLTAPAFGIAAAIFIITGEFALNSRWSPQILAAVHLVILGFALPIMIGSMFQMLPVVAGSVVAGSERISNLIYAGLFPGVIALCFALFRGHWSIAAFFITLLPVAIALFIFVTLRALFQAQTAYETVATIKLAIISLLITAILGSILVMGNMGILPLYRPALTNHHLNWGLAGWTALLIFGVAYQVIPMFHVTPPFPPKMRKSLAWMIFTLLILHLVFYLLPIEIPYQENIIKSLMILVLSTFAVATMYLFSKRKRKIPDTTINFWRLAMIMLLLTCFLWGVGTWLPYPSLMQRELLLGTFFLMGFVSSVICGMLHKIAPFLVWFHLQAHQMAALQKGEIIQIPHMKQILPEKKARRQFFAHLLASLLLPGAILLQYLRIPAAIAMIISFGLLWEIIIKAWRMYRKIRAC